MSEFNRRDLLKFFGIGATIVPLVGGTPELRAPARLIETPTLDLDLGPDLRALQPVRPVGYEEVDVHMSYVGRAGRPSYGFHARSFLVTSHCESVPAKVLGSLYPLPIAPLRAGLEWSFTGVVYGPCTLLEADGSQAVWPPGTRREDVLNWLDIAR